MIMCCSSSLFERSFRYSDKVCLKLAFLGFRPCMGKYLLGGLWSS